MQRSISCTLKVGMTVIEIQCPTGHLARRLKRYFMARATPDQTCSLAISLGISRQDEGRAVSDSLFAEKTAGNGAFSLGGGALEGRYDAKSGKADVLISEQLLTGRMMRVFEQFLYQAFYTDERNQKADTFLIHASGVIRGGKGFVFTGPSGSGKSTICGLCTTQQILNDEICLISADADGARVSSTPFNGFYRRKTDGAAPLEGVFFLSHGETHAVRKIEKTSAVAALLQQIVPPIGLDQTVGREAISRMLDLGERLLEKVPAYSLSFRKDRGFWAEIDRAREKRLQ